MRNYLQDSKSNRFSWAVLAGAALLVATLGCAPSMTGSRKASSGSSGLSSLVPGNKEAKLRKQVEADKFPAAKDVGLATAKE